MEHFDIRKVWSDADKEEIPIRQKQAHKNMEEIAKLTIEMMNDGWRSIIYCPKDESMFWAWDPTMSMPYCCAYRGEWPDGSWDAYVHGDIFPCQPVLFKAEK